MNIAYAGHTDTGKIKKNNEDCLYLPVDGRVQDILIVADGMGGYNGGEMASSIAVDIALNIVEMNADSEARIVIRRAIEAANDAIYEYASTRETCQGMGTTIVMAVFQSDKWIVGHVGDSRAYWVNDDGIRQLTRDHSLVQELLDNGKLTPEAALTFPYRNVIMRAVGTQNEVEIDINECDFHQGDTLLLSSDGLTRHVSDEEIQKLICKNTPQAAAEKLVALARRRGGLDNITVAIASARENRPC